MTKRLRVSLCIVGMMAAGCAGQGGGTPTQPTTPPPPVAGPAPTPTPTPSPTPTPTPPTTPVILNNGQPVTWTSIQTTIGNASYSPLQIRIVQSSGLLSGSNRDNDREVDVSTVGTIDGSGNVVLTCTLTNGGSPRTVYRFTGTVSGSGSSQTISGTYTGTTPSEAGTFSMRHN